MIHAILLSPLTPLEHLLRHVLDWLHNTLGLPWAWSIVGLTVIVRVLLVPLTVRQIHSMQNLQSHAPQMKEIQRKYKGDRQKQNEELMRFYRENSINPAASCLPLVAQFPVFIGLYYTLRTFSRHPPKGDLSWLHVVPNIAAHANSHWSGYLLLAIYAISQMASTFLMGTTMDKTQRTLLLIMPLVFLAVVAHFPAGLVLYWMTTNLWTVGQGLITRRLVPKKGDVPAPKRSSRTPPREAAEDGAAKKPAAPEPAARTNAPPKRVKRKKKKGGARR
ncbi:MAG TPA: YidC/Oxa1 family membrane protein insertase [Gaiellaceae bacterium]